MAAAAAAAVPAAIAAAAAAAAVAAADHVFSLVHLAQALLYHVIITVTMNVGLKAAHMNLCLLVTVPVFCAIVWHEGRCGLSPSKFW